MVIPELNKMSEGRKENGRRDTGFHKPDQL